MMKWMLIAIVYTVTADTVPHEAMTYDLGFATEALCVAAREKAEADLRTRAITVKATCVQVAE